MKIKHWREKRELGITVGDTLERNERERERERERGNEERERASFRQSGAASALGPVWVQSLIKKPSTFTQRHKTAGRDEREGPSTRCTVTSTQQLSERERERERAGKGWEM